MAKKFATISIHDLLGRPKRGTSIGRKPISSTMNKNKRRSFKKYRGQGKQMVQNETNETRLNRIEQKIDKLADAMISLARAEEKIVALQVDHDNMRDRMNKLSVKLDEIQQSVDKNAHTVSIINKVVYAAMVAAVGAYVAHMWM